jgi:hypothetical protein
VPLERARYKNSVTSELFFALAARLHPLWLRHRPVAGAASPRHYELDDRYFLEVRAFAAATLNPNARFQRQVPVSRWRHRRAVAMAAVCTATESSSASWLTLASTRPASVGAAGLAMDRGIGTQGLTEWPLSRWAELKPVRSQQRE